MIDNPPLINFNGAFQVESLVVGSIQIQSKRVAALKIILHQTLDYPVLAYGPLFAEIYAYCLEARRGTKTQLEVYAPCFLMRDTHDDSLIPVVSSLTWYIPSDWRQQCARQVDSILRGESPKAETYPAFDKNIFARFSEKGQ